MQITTSLFYFPTAVLLGALHALEPGHAKTLTAAYLIGVKGTRRDAVVLGISVATTHSLIVVGLCVAALYLGREAFTDEATYWLQLSSGILVILLGTWLLLRRLRRIDAVRTSSALNHSHHHHHSHQHEEHHHANHEHVKHDHFSPHEHHHHDHGDDSDLHHDDLAHARAHAADLPDYVQRGGRPSLAQIIAFGAAGGLVPCPAAITVMLLSFSAQKTGMGLFLVLGFSFGLAATLVSVGLAVVTGLTRISKTSRVSWLSKNAALISAGLVIFSGVLSLIIAVMHAA